MQVEVFKNFQKRINSTLSPASSGLLLNVRLKDLTSINTPSFLLSQPIDNITYLKWDKRYYYIDDIIYNSNSIIEVRCSLDVLATYKQEIKNTSAFVEYSSSNFNTDIIDNRLSISTKPVIQKVTKTLFNDGVTNLDLISSNYNGSFLLNYVSDTPTVGGCGLAFLSKSAISGIVKTLSSPEFLTPDSLKRQFTQPYNALLSCKYFPFNIKGENDIPVHLGSYNTGIFGIKPASIYSYGVNIDLPIQFNDFRRSSSYTEILVYLPAYGFTSINIEDLEDNKLNISAYLDGLTGSVTYHINNIFKGTTTLAVDIPIGTNTQASNYTGFLTGVISAGGFIASGNVLGAIGGITGAATSLAGERLVGNIGSAGGISGLISPTTEDWRNVGVMVITHNTLTPPQNLTSTMGRPLQAVVNLGTLTGYVKTFNASIKTTNNEHTKEINNIINGEGLYIE